MERHLTLAALERALSNGEPLIHHSDQGVQYACHDYTHRLLEVGAQISMADAGAAWQNGYAERLVRTIKEEVKWTCPAMQTRSRRGRRSATLSKRSTSASESTRR
ncbi:MAG: hypothetical protein AAGI71_08315 [Bacteroidota bacterium]